MFSVLFQIMNMFTDNSNDMNMIVSNEYDSVETTYFYSIILCLAIVYFLKLYTYKKLIIYKLTKDIQCKDDIICELRNDALLRVDNLRQQLREEQKKVKQLRDMEFIAEDEYKQEIKKVTSDIEYKDATIASLRDQLFIFTKESQEKVVKLYKELEDEKTKSTNVEHEYKQEINKLTREIQCKDDKINELHEQIHLFTKEAEEIAVKKLEYDTKKMNIRELVYNDASVKIAEESALRVYKKIADQVCSGMKTNFDAPYFDRGPSKAAGIKLGTLINKKVVNQLGLLNENEKNTITDEVYREIREDEITCESFGLNSNHLPKFNRDTNDILGLKIAFTNINEAINNLVVKDCDPIIYKEIIKEFTDKFSKEIYTRLYQEIIYYVVCNILLVLLLRVDYMDKSIYNNNQCFDCNYHKGLLVKDLIEHIGKTGNEETRILNNKVDERWRERYWHGNTPRSFTGIIELLEGKAGFHVSASTTKQYLDTLNLCLKVSEELLMKVANKLAHDFAKLSAQILVDKLESEVHSMFL